MRVRIAVALSFLSAAVALAQQPVAETVEVTLVEVPVTVIGPGGEPVRGLTRENFEIYDRGKKREITNFDVVDFGSAGGAAARSGTRIAAPARRNFMLLFDLGNSTPASLLRAREAAVEFTAKQLSRGDRVAVATIHPHRGFQLLAAFTTEREMMKAAIETLGHPQFFTVRDPLLLTNADAGVGTAPGRETSAGQAGGALADEIRDHLEQLVAGSQSGAREAQRQQVTRQIALFGGLGRVLDRIAGRKHVILLSEGFDASVLRGRESVSVESNVEERRAVESGEVWKVDTDAIYGSAAAGTELRQMTDVLRRSDVVLHAIDIKGLRTNVDAREGVRQQSNEALFLITRDTGGEVFQNTNRLEEDFTRFLKSQEVTYVLGFRGDSSQPGAFHELRVKLINAPRGSRVTHRPGYYETAAASNDLDRRLTAGEIIMNALPVSDLEVSALATAFPREDGVADVPVIVEVRGEAILQTASGSPTPLEFFIYAFDEEELIRDYVYQRVMLDLDKLRERLSGAGAKLYHTLRLRPGDYSIRILARAGAATNGFTEVSLNIPGPGLRMITPPLVFDDAARWAMVRGPARRGVSPQYPFQVDERVFVPAALPVLTGGGRSEFALFAFHTPGKINASATLEGSAAPTPLTVELIKRVPQAEGVEKIIVAVDTPKVAPGNYELVVIVREEGAASEERLVRLPVTVVR